MTDQSLGPYRIQRSLGAGGMGEVFLADDTRLGRQVAVKVLPAEYAAIPERLARFEQEARAAAALNHPNIATIYDVGFAEGVALGTATTSTGTHYFVQEYLQGRSLRGALGERMSLDLALQLGVEIAEGLAAAHRKGIVHRDLKPENVFVTTEGHAKILDFGLAKLTEFSAISSPGGATLSPTIVGTVAGQIMGTAGYMAPEQIEGAEVDGRADLFAFGCVLYEMVAGKRPFEGRSVHETLSHIVHDAPAPLPETEGAALPAELRRIIAKCLAKDRTRRYQHADDLAVDLQALRADVRAGLALPGAETMAVASEPQVVMRGVRAPVAAAAALVLAVVAAAAAWWLRVPEEPPVRRVSLSIAEAPPAPFAEGNIVAISPDESRIAYVGMRDGQRRLYLRALDGFDAQELSGTEGAHVPDFSPDGRWLAFSSPSELLKVGVDGGRPLSLADITPPLFLAWADDGNIYFSQGRQLMRVPPAGGDPEVVVDPPEGSGVQNLYVTDVLPGSDRAVLTEGFGSSANVAVYEFGTGARRVIAEGANGGRYSSGYLLFNRAGSGFAAVPFDARSGQATGDPRPIQDPIGAGFGPMMSISPGGTLVYAPGGTVDRGSAELVWVDRSGNATSTLADRRNFDVPRLSPDGNRIAVALGENEGRDLWIIELQPEPIMRRWTFEADDRHPLWGRDGGSLVFRSASRDEKTGMFVKSADDSVKPAEMLLETPALAVPHGWMEDGTLLYHVVGEGGNRELMLLPSGTTEPVPFMATQFNEQGAAVSPDSRWIVYTSNQSGSNEIYARPYPGPDPEYVISNGGGTQPMWSRDGSEIFYRDGDNRMVAVRVETGDRLQVLERQQLFDTVGFLSNFARTPYDVHPDGRFLMVRVAEVQDAGAQLHLVENFGAVLRGLFER